MVKGGYEDEARTEAHETGTGEGLDSDKSLRIGSSHGEATEADEKTGYARDITPEGQATATGREARSRGSGLSVGDLSSASKGHPSKNLRSRSRGFGIGGGYERPYRKERPKTAESEEGLYGPLPHSGYYGSGLADRPFKKGQAGFAEELSWYRLQYGEETSGYGEVKKKG